MVCLISFIVFLFLHPVPGWADMVTYVGGSEDDWIYGVEVDREGNLYVVGKTYSRDFPCLPINGVRGDLYDAFVMKLDHRGRVLYSYCIGGSGNDWALDLAMDEEGDLYITGMTSSKDFPLIKPFQDRFGGGLADAFVIKLKGATGKLVYSSYLGGNDDDRGHAIAVGKDGRVFVTGRTFSDNLPSSPFKREKGWDAFLAGISRDGRLYYFTYIGGGGYDVGNDVAMGRDGRIYITGATTSRDFPCRDRSLGWDAFVMEVDTEKGMLYSTCIGGSGEDGGFGISVGPAGRAYITGRTSSMDFPLLTPAQRDRRGRVDAFVTILDPSGDLLYSTYIGGSGVDWGYALTLDGSYLHVVGMTSSPDFPGASTPFKGLYDIFYARLTLSKKRFSSRLMGGGGEDRPFDVKISKDGVVIGGYTFSVDLPSTRPYNGEGDGFIIETGGSE